jgi:hypothetical protein
MTIKYPEVSIADKFLKLLGKKRGIKIPYEAYEKFGPYVYVKAQKENFWKALFRSKDQSLPKDMIDISSFQNQK